MSEPETAAQANPPSTITPKPFTLDDVLFTPTDNGRIENATRDGALIGHVLHDDNRSWFARKFDAHGEMSDWKPMRCCAEARAYLVSRIRQ